MKEEIYINNLMVLFKEIESQLAIEKDPLARCELAKGYCQIGKVLRGYTIIR